MQIQHNMSVKDIYNNDVVALSVPRESVESSDFKQFNKTFEKFETAGVAGADKLIITFDGYALDPREVYEIPEVRKYVATIVKRYPHILYFTSITHPLAHGQVNTLIACISDCTAYKRPGPYSLTEEYLLKVVMDKSMQDTLKSSAINYAKKLGDDPQKITDRLHRIGPLNAEVT